MQPKSERQGYQNESRLPLFSPNYSDPFGLRNDEFFSAHRKITIFSTPIGVQFPDFEIEVSLFDPFRASVKGFVFQPETITVGVELL